MNQSRDQTQCNQESIYEEYKLSSQAYQRSEDAKTPINLPQFNQSSGTGCFSPLERITTPRTTLGLALDQAVKIDEKEVAQNEIEIE